MNDRRLLEAAIRRREAECNSRPWKQIPHDIPGNPTILPRRNLLPKQLNLLQWSTDGQSSQASRT